MMPYPHRVARALCALDGQWRCFDEIADQPVPIISALDSKQLTGTLVAMRNRGVVQSRRLHRDTGTEVTQWRLHPRIARMAATP